MLMAQVSEQGLSSFLTNFSLLLTEKNHRFEGGCGEQGVGGGGRKGAESEGWHRVRAVASAPAEVREAERCGAAGNAPILSLSHGTPRGCGALHCRGACAHCNDCLGGPEQGRGGFVIIEAPLLLCLAVISPAASRDGQGDC